MNEKRGTVLFIPHGGGPLPILGDSRHKRIIKFLKNIKFRINKPSSIIVISAHWEEDEVKITSGEKPSLIYDYRKSRIIEFFNIDKKIFF